MFSVREELYRLFFVLSAYEVAEDLQGVAEELGQSDEGWKNFARLLKNANSHVNSTGEFPN